jgi:hypothetical protein
MNQTLCGAFLGGFVGAFGTSMLIWWLTGRRR